MKLINFLKANTAESSGRLLAFALVGAGIVIAIAEISYCFFVNKYEIHQMLVMELIGSGVAMKIGTKHIEKRSQTNDSQ